LAAANSFFRTVKVLESALPVLVANLFIYFIFLNKRKSSIILLSSFKNTFRLAML
jgi:hypothetical protein